MARRARKARQNCWYLWHMRISFSWLKRRTHVFDWFVDNELSIHFGKHKAFFCQRKKYSIKNNNKTGTSDLKYGGRKINNFQNLGCKLDNNLSLPKVGLDSSAWRDFQPHFNYARSTWYPDLNEKFKY